MAVSLTILLIATRDYRERMALRADLLSDGADYAHVNRDRSIRLLFAHEIQSFDFAKYDRIELLELQDFHLDSESLPKLAVLKHVDVLMLQSCTIENAQVLTPLARVGCIDSLLIWNTPIKDDAIDSIAGIPGLETVDLSNTQVTPAGIDQLRAALPDTDVRIRP